MATANYTEQQTKEMVAQYEANPTKDTVVAIALSCQEKVSTRHNQELLKEESL